MTYLMYQLTFSNESRIPDKIEVFNFYKLCKCYCGHQCSLQFLIMLHGKNKRVHWIIIFVATAHCLQTLLQLRRGILAAAHLRGNIGGHLHKTWYCITTLLSLPVAMFTEHYVF